MTTKISHSLADFGGIILDIDPSFCEMLEREPDEIVGRHLLAITDPRDRGHNLALLDGLRDEGRSYIITKRFLRGDGAPVKVRNHVSIFRDGLGAPRLVAATEWLGLDAGPVDMILPTYAMADSIELYRR